MMPAPVKLRRRLVRDEIHDAIRDAILDGTYQPGDKLNEAELQEWFGVSRTPIREALNALTAEGLVETAAQSYTRVVVPDPEETIGVLQTAGVLLSAVAHSTLPTMSAAERRRVASDLERCATAAADGNAKQLKKHAETYSRTLLAACPNAYLVRLCLAASSSLRHQLSTTYVPSDWAAMAESYSTLARAVTELDLDTVRAAIERLHAL